MDRKWRRLHRPFWMAVEIWLLQGQKMEHGPLEGEWMLEGQKDRVHGSSHTRSQHGCWKSWSKRQAILGALPSPLPVLLRHARQQGASCAVLFTAVFSTFHKLSSAKGQKFDSCSLLYPTAQFQAHCPKHLLNGGMEGW